MNHKIYSNFDLNHFVAYFSFGNLDTFCMHRLTRKQPIRRLVLGDVISRSFLPERFLTISNISHDWREDKFPFTMIYRLTIISFNYHCYTGIYDKMHGSTKEVDIRASIHASVLLERNGKVNINLVGVCFTNTSCLNWRNTIFKHQIYNANLCWTLYK